MKGRPQISDSSDVQDMYLWWATHLYQGSAAQPSLKRVNKALYYSADGRAHKSTGTAPTRHSVRGKPDKQEQGGNSSCQVR